MPILPQHSFDTSPNKLNDVQIRGSARSRLSFLNTLYDNQGINLAHLVYEMMNQATDQLLDLEESHRMSSKMQPQLNTCNTLRVKAQLHIRAEKRIETAIQSAFFTLRQRFERDARLYNIRFDSNEKRHTKKMLTHIEQLANTELSAMKAKLKNERLLEPLYSQGKNLVLVQRKFKYIDGQLFPPSAPFETRFNCKLPM